MNIRILRAAVVVVVIVIINNNTLDDYTITLYLENHFSYYCSYYDQ